ncbi:hypothetical protein DVDV_0430 [Desulfovibrio sp. DV]|nr:hypothetical protein DVDV_0430 [Desulfovibrio sp. DV]
MVSVVLGSHGNFHRRARPGLENNGNRLMPGSPETKMGAAAGQNLGSDGKAPWWHYVHIQTRWLVIHPGKRRHSRPSLWIYASITGQGCKESMRISEGPGTSTARPAADSGHGRPKPFSLRQYSRAVQYKCDQSASVTTP